MVVLAVGGLVALDYAARVGTQDLIATNVKRSTHSEKATASISSFPFLYDIAAEGRIGGVTVTDTGVPAGPFRIQEVELDASDVHFARSELLQHHNVHITEVGRATVTVVASLSGLEGALAQQLDVQVVATGSDRIRITAEGRTVATVDLTRIPIVPTCPITVSHTGDTYRFSCTVAPVPPTILEALSKAASKKIPG